MDRSLGTPASPRIQDVTPQIQKSHLIYGASDYTNPAYSSSNRSLNYAVGGSIHRPELDRVTIIPYSINYQDSVGLFGKENHFVRVNVNINRESALACFEEEGWECAVLREGLDLSTVNTYVPVTLNPLLDPDIVNTFEPAEISNNSLVSKSDAYISVDLENLKTGNKYIDSWFDVRLYNSEREEHPFDKMYVRLNDFFYIGFHARNTKRLPYNVRCVIGNEYLSGLDEGSRHYRNKVRY